MNFPPPCKLNLGSGEFPLEGFLNVDAFSVSAPDLVHDLNSLPYPFLDDSFEEVRASHVLEHLDDPFAVMREIHRVAQPGALVEIRVPHFSRGLAHAEHRRGFDLRFADYFNPAFQGGYQGVHFELEKVRLQWFAQRHLAKTFLSRPTYLMAAAGSRVIDTLANWHPLFCTRIWCFWVGGFEEISFRFRVKKAKKL